mmetsp:Transcript_2358/g.4778  ORF Transcript_2358/g.4778 Transcript_2358/m.4778 type:complete len:265 (-) Transcript_2358:3727-4521(-)
MGSTSGRWDPASPLSAADMNARAATAFLTALLFFCSRLRRRAILRFDSLVGPRRNVDFLKSILKANLEGASTTAVITPTITLAPMFFASIPKNTAEMAICPSTMFSSTTRRWGRVKSSPGSTVMIETRLCWVLMALAIISCGDLEVSSDLASSVARAPPFATPGLLSAPPGSSPRPLDAARRASTVEILAARRLFKRSLQSFLYPMKLATEKPNSTKPTTKMARAFSRLMLAKSSASGLGSANSGTTSSAEMAKVDRCTVSQRM